MSVSLHLTCVPLMGGPRPATPDYLPVGGISVSPNARHMSRGPIFSQTRHFLHGHNICRTFSMANNKLYQDGTPTGNDLGAVLAIFQNIGTYTNINVLPLLTSIRHSLLAEIRQISTILKNNVCHSLQANYDWGTVFERGFI